MFDESTPPAEEEQLVVFRLGEDYFAMLIAAVNEIIRMQKITAVPRAPSFVEGVTNLRGRVIPVVDLRKRFGIVGVDDPRSMRIIVVEHADKLIGMMVDGVDEVLTVPTTVIEPPDEMVVSFDSQFLAGIVRLDDRLIIMLDHEQVLTATELQQLGKLKVTGKALKEVEAQQESAELEAAGAPKLLT